MRKTIAILAFCLFLCGCNAVSEQHEEELEMDNKPTRGTINERWTQLLEENRKYLLTPEEFLQLISENEDILGVTVSDFDEIDLEDFIERNIFTENLFQELFITGSGNFRAAYETYVNALPRRILDSLLPQELVIADSTDEEYEEFKARFFEGIGHEISPWSHWDRVAIVDGITEGYEFTGVDGEFDGFVVGRTMFIEQLKEMRWRFKENPVWAYIPDGDMETGSHMFLSSCGRFFLIYVSSPDLVELFIGLDASDADR